MSDDNENKKIEVHNSISTAIADGPNARAYAKTVFNIPIEKFLMAELATAIVVQWLMMLCSLTTPSTVFIIGSWATFCFPAIFGPNAIYGLVMGSQLKNNKIILLSLLAGLSSLLPLPVMMFGILIQLFLKSISIPIQ